MFVLSWPKHLLEFLLSLFFEFSKCNFCNVLSEPGLLADLEQRVSEAEAKFLEADLELKLEELEQAKQRQVGKNH